MQGICMLAYMPVRAQAAHRSEQISQWLFGTSFTVLHTEGEWLYAQSHTDNYKGYVQAKQVYCVEQQLAPSTHYVSSHELVVEVEQQILNLPYGAALPTPTEGGFTWAGRRWYIREGTYCGHHETRPLSLLKAIVPRWLNAPYLWGGCTFWGCDCSGLVQTLFRGLGYVLPRDSSVQATCGDAVEYEALRFGDLVFFSEGDQRITHVGIVWTEGRVLHASGKVRLDRLDKQGIYTSEGYSHFWCTARRITQASELQNI